MASVLINTYKALVSRIRYAFEMRKYDSYTIAELLRKRGSQIGEGCSIHVNRLGTEPYLVKLGNHVAIAQGVRFITHDGGVWVFRHEFPDMQVFGPIIIEDNCVIGENAVLFPNVRIGRNSIVGAGSVVITDVPPDTIAIGIPARPFGAVSKYREKAIERWNVQRPPDVVIEPGANWWSSRHFGENREKLKQHLLKVFAKDLGKD